jgi:tRNA(His) 5'-end guanylyltransferase
MQLSVGKGVCLIAVPAAQELCCRYAQGVLLVLLSAFVSLWPNWRSYQHCPKPFPGLPLLLLWLPILPALGTCTPQCLEPMSQLIQKTSYMKFSQLDEKMRLYETAADQFVPPGFYIVARLDGRGFTKLTKETLYLEKPFDFRFREAMSAATEHLMQSGFNFTYAYTQSDEISLLFHREDASFNRLHRKLLSILAGEASAAFTHALGHIGAFDARLSVLPTEKVVADYFSWRAEDANRNALSAYCYWKLRERGLSLRDASERIYKLSVGEKNELLFSLGINYNDLPAWQKRGMGFYWKMAQRKGFDPVRNTETQVLRRTLHREVELPIAGYREMILNLITHSPGETEGRQLLLN